MKNWGTETVRISYATFKHTKGMENILADHMLCLRSIHLNDSLDPEGQ